MSIIQRRHFAMHRLFKPMHSTRGGFSLKIIIKQKWASERMLRSRWNINTKCIIQRKPQISTRQKEAGTASRASRAASTTSTGRKKQAPDKCARRRRKPETPGHLAEDHPGPLRAAKESQMAPRASTRTPHGSPGDPAGPERESHANRQSACDSHPRPVQKRHPHGLPQGCPKDTRGTPGGPKSVL